MMRTFLLFSLVFSCLVSAHVIQKRSNLSEDKKEETVQKFNEVRRRLAKRLGIANMHEVSWDDDLESKIEVSCQNRETYKRMEEAGDRIIVNGTKEDYVNGVTKISGDTTIFNCIIPTQTEFACAFETCSEEDVIANCRCGPHTSFSQSDLKMGTPGSECDNDDDDGLCVDGSSAVFNIGTILNLVLIYLLIFFI